MTIALIILGLIMALIGLIGCVLPVVPGPPLSFAALIILSLAKKWEPFSVAFLVIMGALMVVVTILDYVVPAVGAKRYGASKFGVWGSIAGMIIGIFFFPPWGVFIGTFVGALVGELISGRKGKAALRAGWGVFIGTMVSIGFKLVYSVIVLFFYLKAVFS